MALHKLVIEVYDAGKTQGSTSVDGVDAGDGAKNPQEEKIPKLSPSDRVMVSLMKQTASQVKNAFMSYYVSDIGRSNGDSNYQAQINRKLEIASDIGGLFSGAVAGFKTAGPLGAFVGAGFSLMSLGVKYAERERAYAHEMFKQNNSQAYNLARANYSATTGRRR